VDRGSREVCPHDTATRHPRPVRRMIIRWKCTDLWRNVKSGRGASRPAASVRVACERPSDSFVGVEDPHEPRHRENILDVFVEACDPMSPPFVLTVFASASNDESPSLLIVFRLEQSKMILVMLSDVRLMIFCSSRLPSSSYRSRP